MKPLQTILLLGCCTAVGFAVFPQTSVAQTATDPVIKMVSHGAMPRKKLRYRLTPNTVFRMKITMHMNIRMKIRVPKREPILQNVQIPPLSLVNEIRCKKRETNGDAHIYSRLVEAKPIEVPGQDPNMVASIQKEMQKLQGMSIEYTVSNQGDIKASRVVFQPNMAPQFRQLMTNIQNSFRQMVTPLPKEPVGLGASWTVTNVLTQPFRVKQATRFQLLQRQGSALELSVEATQNARSQQRMVQTMGQSVPVTMSIQSKGQGKTVLKLDSLFINSSLHMLSNMMVNTANAQGSQQVHTTMDIKTYIRSRQFTPR